MNKFSFAPKLKYTPELDPTFCPIAVSNVAYKKALSDTDNKVLVKMALERGHGQISVCEAEIFGDESAYGNDNMIYVERLVKTLIWLKGGWKLYFAGPSYIADYLSKAYTPGGAREFDNDFMFRIYENPFTVVSCEYDQVPAEKEDAKPMGKNLDGYRIGFDAGGSDRKVSAVVDGKAIYSEEVVWHPKLQSDPFYHYEGIMDSMRRAAEKMPRVDAIGVSSAGVYIDNRIMAASLFIQVEQDVFDREVKDMFFRVAKEFGNVPIEVANDGDVTALAGAMSLEENCILGIAMGTAEAAGYVDANGYITGWLNELAFVPVDYSPEAMVDEWSGDIGCGVKYFSQDSVIKLAPAAGIELDPALSPAEKLKVVQDLMVSGDERAKKIYESIGSYLGYTLAYYAEFYDINHVLLMGRVTSGEGGNILVDRANLVLREEFPHLAQRMIVSLPDEKSRRVGQSVAAASLPVIG